MPEIKDYEGKKKSAGSANQKRRPHREGEESSVEASEQKADILEATGEINTEAQNEGFSSEELADKDKATATATGTEGEDSHNEHQKIHLEFYGSDIIREKAPKVMELAETVVEEWMQDGEFQGLPVGHPLAQMAAAKVLRKAKDVEKKLEEKGVIAMAKMGAEYLKSEIQKRKKK